MATAEQMFDHRLNPVKAWPSPYALDKSKEIADGEDGIVAGRVIHIDATAGAFKLGLNGNVMPIFAWAGFGEFDTVGVDDGNISNHGNRKGTTGFVATGSFEVQTTEFVSGETYNPNTPLTADDGGVTPGDKGKVKPGVYYTDTICGVVSDGQETNAHGKDVVTLWTYFLPSQP